jgi:hypothetical protein
MMCLGWSLSTSLRTSWAPELLRLFFEPRQLHLQFADLLEQLCLLGLPFFLVFALFAAGEQLAGAIQHPPLPLAQLDWVNGVISSDLLNRLATTNRFHGDLGFEIRAMCTVFAQLLRRRLRQRWNPVSWTVPRLSG